MKKTLFALVFAAAFAHAEDTITIALAGPETGPVTQYGTIQKIGAEAAIDFLNANGGFNGKKLVVKSYDDACEPKQAVTVANQIVNDGVKFVIGHLCSSSTMPAAEIYDENGIVMITAASTSPELSQKGYSTILRTIGTDLQSAPVSAAYIADVIKPKHIALLHDKQAYGQGLVDAVAADLKARGIEPVIVEGVNKGQSDFSALITKLKNANVDFVYWGGFHPEAGAILRQGADQGFKPVFMGADGVDNADLFAIAGSAAEGVLATVPMDFLPRRKTPLLLKPSRRRSRTRTARSSCPVMRRCRCWVRRQNAPVATTRRLSPRRCARANTTPLSARSVLRKTATSRISTLSCMNCTPTGRRC